MANIDSPLVNTLALEVSASQQIGRGYKVSNNIFYDNTNHVELADNLSKAKRLHFVGIGGAGMSALAEVVLHQGYHVTGSDNVISNITTRLQQLGATIYSYHAREHIDNVDIVVVSSAIKSTNPEVLSAKREGILVIKRAQLLATLMAKRFSIAVAGTHGKTTTAGLLTDLLMAANLDPAFVMGGRLYRTQSHSRLGLGRYLVAEADESDQSFLHLSPTVAVVTNINSDHLSYYGNSLSALRQAFIDFINQLPANGSAVVCREDKTICQMLSQIKKPIISYGFGQKADIYAVDIQQKRTTMRFTTIRKHHQALSVQLNLPGRHNVLNALAVIAVATQLKVADKVIVSALKQFLGIHRRFDIKGYYYFNHKRMLMIDDYGHHPQELAMTVMAASNAWPDKKIAMVFQPHRFTRVRELFDEFITVLEQVDALYLLPVYAAGELPQQGVDAYSLYQRLAKRCQVRVMFIANRQRLLSVLMQTLKGSELLLMQGAGDIGQLTENLIKLLQPAST